MAIAGEVRNPLKYTPGEKPAESQPVPEGDYNLTLQSFGPEGMPGWTAKPGKFPNRKMVWTIDGSEDELTGNEKRVTTWLSLSPGALFQTVQLAHASGYPEELELQMYKNVGDPLVAQNAELCDQLLNYIKENGVSVRAYLKVEEYNGRSSNKVGKYLPPADEVAYEVETAVEAAEALEAEEVEAEAAVKPTPATRKPAPKMLAKPQPKPVLNGHKGKPSAKPELKRR